MSVANKTLSFSVTSMVRLKPSRGVVGPTLSALGTCGAVLHEIRNCMLRLQRLSHAARCKLQVTPKAVSCDGSFT